MVVEHRLARLVQLGIRQARYFGQAKTRFQLYLAATVANLTLVAGKAGPMGDTKPIPRWDVHFRSSKTTPKTPRLFISPLVPNWVATDIAV